MAAPTLVSTTRSTNYGASSTNKDTASVSWNSGDLILINGVTGDNASVTATTPTATGLTFAAVTGYPSNTANRMKHYAWQATASGSGSSAIACTFSVADEGGISVRVWRNHNGLGATPAPNQSAGSSAPTRTITTTAANSAVDCSWSSWNRATGARTYLSINGSPTEDGYHDTAAYGTSAHFYYPDAGAAGADTAGTSAPAATNWVATAIEVLGVSGGAAPINLLASQGVG